MRKRKSFDYSIKFNLIMARKAFIIAITILFSQEV